MASVQDQGVALRGAKLGNNSGWGRKASASRPPILKRSVVGGYVRITVARGISRVMTTTLLGHPSFWEGDE